MIERRVGEGGCACLRVEGIDASLLLRRRSRCEVLLLWPRAAPDFGGGRRSEEILRRAGGACTELTAALQFSMATCLDNEREGSEADGSLVRGARRRRGRRLLFGTDVRKWCLRRQASPAEFELRFCRWSCWCSREEDTIMSSRVMNERKVRARRDCEYKRGTLRF